MMVLYFLIILCTGKTSPIIPEDGQRWLKFPNWRMHSPKGFNSFFNLMLLLPLVSFVFGDATVERYSSTGKLSLGEVTINVQALHDTLSHWSAPKRDLISILGSKDQEQMVQLSAAYAASYGVKLSDVIQSKTGSNFGVLCVGLVQTPHQHDAHVVKDTLTKWGSKDPLLDTLIGRSNEDVKNLSKVYKELFNDDLEALIKKKTSGDYSRFFVAIMQAGRDETDTVQDVSADVQSLYSDGQKRWVGKDTSTFFEILQTRSEKHLKLVFEAYKVYLY
jgi:hypothetical protein